MELASSHAMISFTFLSVSNQQFIQSSNFAGFGMFDLVGFSLVDFVWLVWFAKFGSKRKPVLQEEHNFWTP